MEDKHGFEGPLAIGPVQIAHVLEGPNRGPCTQDVLVDQLRADTLAWAHLNGTDPRAAGWIAEHLYYLDQQTIDALLDVDTRPRALRMGDGLLVNLRGINFNAGEKPEDMVSVRLYVDAHRVVTIARKDVRAVARLDRAVRLGHGPATAGGFLADLVQDLVGDIAVFQKALDDRIEGLEDRVIAEHAANLRRDVVDIRLQVIAARRFIVPQRDVLHSVARRPLPFLDAAAHRDIEEEADRMTRVVEDLDELRDQAMVLREELSGQLSDRLNRNMFVLSILSAVFLPLGFLTGLFGVNVAGMPGLQASHAFLFLCLCLGGVVVFELLVLWRLRWLGRRSS